MKKFVFLAVLLWMTVMPVSFAQPVSMEQAEKAAAKWINQSQHAGYQIGDQQNIIIGQDILLAYRFDLNPCGYMILPADRSLPPVIAYSFSSGYAHPDIELNPLEEMLIADLQVRMGYLPNMGEKQKAKNRKQWDDLVNGSNPKAFFEQWPPAGTTSTGGWLETNWTQSAPYNNFCPMDEVTGLRSIAGCPAVALSMIIHYQKNLNGIQFNDGDDYYHNYSGRQYWIDDDAHTMEFPSFPELNVYFDSIAVKFTQYTPLNTNEIAALVFACGVSAKQVYTSGVSGTFGVDQAYDAYMRFGYPDAMLIYESDTSFYSHMEKNMKDGIPVHLALLVDGGGGGHNVVTDGYNTDDYYHLNFGWGGSYNGWYLLPEEIPYNLTIVEGAIMDIGSTHVGIDKTAEKEEMNISIFPNPSYGMTNISLELKVPASIKIFVSDQKGAIMEVISEGWMKSGNHQIQWNNNLPSGMYYIILERNKNIYSKKLIIRQ